MIENILIIEDEKPNADRLKRLIKAIKPQVEILAVIDSVADSIAWFATHEQPDMVLSDIRLSDGISFEIFDKITLTCPIIFTTAYDEYAIKAFKYNSIDYLLKPIEQEELEAAFTKWDSIVTTGDPVSLKGLLDYIQPKEFRTRFLLSFKDGYKSLKVEDIAYFYSEFKITHAHLQQGQEDIVPQTLEELEQQLDPKVFFRVNRQYIVHINDIQRVHNYFNGKLKLELRSNPEADIVVSRDKAQLLRNWMDF